MGCIRYLDVVGAQSYPALGDRQRCGRYSSLLVLLDDDMTVDELGRDNPQDKSWAWKGTGRTNFIYERRSVWQILLWG